MTSRLEKVFPPRAVGDMGHQQIAPILGLVCDISCGAFLPKLLPKNITIETIEKAAPCLALVDCGVT